jgi:hypothetical protein
MIKITTPNRAALPTAISTQYHHFHVSAGLGVGAGLGASATIVLDMLFLIEALIFFFARGATINAFWQARFKTRRMQEGKVIYSLEGPLPWEKLGYDAVGPGTLYEGLVRSDPRIHDLVAKLGHPHALTPPLDLQLLRVQSISVRLERNAEIVVYTPEMSVKIQRALDQINAMRSALHAPLVPALEPTVISAAAPAKAPGIAAPNKAVAPAKAPGAAAPAKAKTPAKTMAKDCACVRCKTPAVGYVNLHGAKEIPVCNACNSWIARQIAKQIHPTLAALKKRKLLADKASKETNQRSQRDKSPRRPQDSRCVRCKPLPAVTFQDLGADKQVPVCAACKRWIDERDEPMLADLLARAAKDEHPERKAKAAAPRPKAKPVLECRECHVRDLSHGSVARRLCSTCNSRFLYGHKKAKAKPAAPKAKAECRKCHARNLTKGCKARGLCAACNARWLGKRKQAAARAAEHSADAKAATEEESADASEAEDSGADASEAKDSEDESSDASESEVSSSASSEAIRPRANEPAANEQRVQAPSDLRSAATARAVLDAFERAYAVAQKQGLSLSTYVHSDDAEARSLRAKLAQLGAHSLVPLLDDARLWAKFLPLGQSLLAGEMTLYEWELQRGALSIEFPMLHDHAVVTVLSEIFH